MKASVIRADGRIDQINVHPGRAALETLQSHVGGYIEVLHVTSGRGRRALVFNEEGRLIGLPHNPLATALAGRPIVGDAVLLDGTMEQLDAER